MESLVGKTNLVFCSGYNAPTLVRNLQKRSLVCRERGTLLTCYPLRITGAWYSPNMLPIAVHWSMVLSQHVTHCDSLEHGTLLTRYALRFTGAWYSPNPLPTQFTGAWYSPNMLPTAVHWCMVLS